MKQMDKLQTKSLLLRVRAGDSPAFTELCDAFWPLLSALVEEILSPKTSFDREEAMQEARLALLRAAGSYVTEQQDVSFGLYAKVCVGNALRSAKRRCATKSGREREHLLSLDELIETRALSPAELYREEDDVARALIGVEEAESLYERIRSELSEFEHEVFLLYADGFSLRDMAEKLGKTPKSVENAVWRSLTKLRYLLR